jgi:hypothetical protein
MRQKGPLPVFVNASFPGQRLGRRDSKVRGGTPSAGEFGPGKSGAIRAFDRLLTEQEVAPQSLCVCGFARDVVSER